MKNSNILILILIIIAIIYSCKDNPTSDYLTGQPPKTFVSIFPDSGITILPQKSQIHVHWWGDDPDGFVIGYYFSWDNTSWKFTTRNDSVFSLSISGLDTVYYFYVAAVDNHGNNKYDNQVIMNGKVIGSEPFTDLNKNGVYDINEPFVDIGMIDPNPAKFKFPIYNSPPELKFIPNTTVPETTYTVASFYWEATDLEGEETIEKCYISLNDTTDFLELPGNVRFVTIISKPPYTTDVVEADLMIGLVNSYTYSKKIKNFKLNNKNFFYVKAKDIAGTYSKIIQMPDTGKTWYVKKVKSEFLVIDDHITSDNVNKYYENILDSLSYNGVMLKDKYDIWDIKFGKSGTTNPKYLPNFIKPTFLETIKLFKYLFWYSADIAPSYNLMEQVTNDYIKQGGKILYSIIPSPEVELVTLQNFLPIDSISAIPLKVVYPNTTLNPGTSGYPILNTDNTSISWIRTYIPNMISSKVLYTMSGIGITGAPVVGFKSNDSRLIYIGLPLNKCNGGLANLKNLFSKVLFEEFGFKPL